MNKEKLPYPDRELPPEVRILCNAAYLMGDVCDTLMLDAQSKMKNHGVDFRHDVRRDWTALKSAVERARRAAYHFSHYVYSHPDAENACEESDFFADLILLIVDRVGDDPSLLPAIRAAIAAFPSRSGVYAKLRPYRADG